MKRILFIVIMLITLFGSIHAKSRIEKCTIQSKILGAERRYTVYLPDGYDEGSDYPVLYLFHGAGGYSDIWVKRYGIQTILDWRIKGGMAHPMLLVMMDGRGDDPKTRRGKHQGYFNYDSWKYEDFFFQEFIPFIEKNYKVRTDRNGRAISGVSMGGGATFIYAMHHPEMFGSACPLFGRGAENSDATKKKNLEPEYLQHILDNDMCKFLKEAPKDVQQKIGTIRWKLYCGDDDYMLKGDMMIYALMKELDFPCANLHVTDGSHSGEYARLCLPDMFTFISIGFYQK
ncbi:MAG: esterase family protein [Alistipes sp.]|nr:esterase family protein [Candidatus Alistipes equi]